MIFHALNIKKIQLDDIYLHQTNLSKIIIDKRTHNGKHWIRYRRNK